MISILDVAAKAGVSKSSVSRYFNGGSVSPATRAKIQDAVQALHYKPNAIGNMLRNNSTNSIALCVPTMVHPFFSSFISEVNKVVIAHGERLIIGESQGKFEGEESFVKMVENNEVDGLILVTHTTNGPLNTSLPIVTVDRHFEGAPCITSTNYDSTMEGLLYLKKKGCRRIAFLGGKPVVESEVNLRYQAYLDFCAQENVAPVACYDDIAHGQEFEKTKPFLSMHPEVDGVFAASDAFALAAYTVNRSLPILAFDGCLAAWVHSPAFTSIRQNIPELAVQSYSLLLRRIAGESLTSILRIPTQFVPGETA